MAHLEDHHLEIGILTDAAQLVLKELGGGEEELESSVGLTPGNRRTGSLLTSGQAKADSPPRGDGLSQSR